MAHLASHVVQSCLRLEGCAAHTRSQTADGGIPTSQESNDFPREIEGTSVDGTRHFAENCGGATG